jgi:hypothetical protein
MLCINILVNTCVKTNFTCFVDLEQLSMPWDVCIEVFGSKPPFLQVWTVITRHGE